MVAPPDTATAQAAAGQRLQRASGDAAPVTRAEFEALLGPALPRLYRLARVLAASDAAAEDLLQVGLVRAFERRAQLVERGSFAPWVARILRNEHAEVARTEGRRRVLLEAAEVGLADLVDGLFGDPPADPETALEVAVSADAVLRELRRLPEAFRVVVWACDVDGLDDGAAAVLLGLKEGTVKSRKSRGRRLLRAALAARGEEP